MSSVYESKILELNNVRFSYQRDSFCIDNLSFSIGEGAFIGLLGANGSGKSTILKLCSGILKPISGNVNLWGRPLAAFKNRDRAKLISFLPQTLDMTLPFTVEELVNMGLYPYDIPPAMNVRDALEFVGLRDKALSYIADLSGGERRRSFIAMTLVQGTGLLLLDEPLANLDIKYQIELFRLLQRLRKERNVSVVMALHDVNMALHFEKVMLIKNGSVLTVGTPGEMLTEEYIRTAFDVGVKIMRPEEGHAYISYGDNFSE